MPIAQKKLTKVKPSPTVQELDQNEMEPQEKHQPWNTKKKVEFWSRLKTDIPVEQLT